MYPDTPFFQAAETARPLKAFATTTVVVLEGDAPSANMATFKLHLEQRGISYTRDLPPAVARPIHIFLDAGVKKPSVDYQVRTYDMAEAIDLIDLIECQTRLCIKYKLRTNVGMPMTEAAIASKCALKPGAVQFYDMMANFIESTRAKRLTGWPQTLSPPAAATDESVVSTIETNDLPETVNGLASQIPAPGVQKPAGIALAPIAASAFVEAADETAVVAPLEAATPEAADTDALSALAFEGDADADDARSSDAGESADSEQSSDVEDFDDSNNWADVEDFAEDDVLSDDEAEPEVPKEHKSSPSDVPSPEGMVIDTPPATPPARMAEQQDDEEYRGTVHFNPFTGKRWAPTATFVRTGNTPPHQRMDWEGYSAYRPRPRSLSPTPEPNAKRARR